MSANPPLFRAITLTLFPEMFPGPLGVSLAGKALEKGIWSLSSLNIRDFSTDKHSTVDDSPYGGGTGMVLKPDVVDRAVEGAKALFNPSPCRGEVRRGAQCDSGIQLSPPHSLPPAGGGAVIIYLTPRGTPFTQALAEKLKNEDLIIVCGRFEGMDQRVIEYHDMLEISLGDFVLSGGEIAALALLDACVRLLPGVIGKADAITTESFAQSSEYAGLLEYPHYTRPSIWNDRPVPEVLLSGNHEQIKTWRLEQAKAITAARRPDLIDKKE